MEDIYLNKIVDITDPYCEFIKQFDKEVYKYGAVVYNHETNSYQFIRKFTDIDYKKELLPDFIKIENSDALLNGLNITIHYQFDPETEEDEENLDIWQKELSQIELPVYAYDDEGQVYAKEYISLNPQETKHTVWFLNTQSMEYIYSLDLLLFTPIIKDMEIIRKLIKDYGVHPFKNIYSEDKDYKVPELKGVYKNNND
ncbi:MAG: hypothetical protein Q4C64_01185 [Erysipelotrichia bacterium]|nr:hypothetical protein [Erysipelotrichia bacterium]